MKIKSFIGSTLFIATLFFTSTSTVQAQFTILPYTDKNLNECMNILNQYAIDQKFPTKDQTASNELIDANKAYEKKYGNQPDTNSCSTPTDKNSPECKNIETKRKNYDNAANQKNIPDTDNVLGCGIKTGKISLSMIPYYVTYVINFMLALIGLICVLFIMVGGYYYVFGGLTDDKDKGKKTIRHALIGLSLAIIAWTLVNVIIKAITG